MIVPVQISEGESAARQRVLIVDDNAVNLNLIQNWVAEGGHLVFGTRGGEAARLAAAEFKPDLLLIDTNLTGINGFELYRQLSEGNPPAKMPVIFMCNVSDIKGKTDSFKSGGTDVITRPYFREEVTSRVENQLQLRRMAQLLASKNEELQRHVKKMTDSINYASRIQKAVLPQFTQLQDRFTQCFLLYQPKDIVSGDFFWFLEKEDQLLVAVADCTGHGVPGAFVTMLGMTLLKQIVLQFNYTSPELILKELHLQIRGLLKQEEIDSQVQDGMDIALCRFDRAAGTLCYAAARRPLYRISEGQLIIYEADKHSIGGRQKEAERCFTLQQIPLRPGDRTYLFSDGITDQFGGQAGNKYGTKAFGKLLLSLSHLPMPEQRERLEQELCQWKGDHKQTDDILVLGIQFH